MAAFLGVPILIRGSVFGSLFLTDLPSERRFTESDEAVATALAGRAAVAIDNAQLFERVRASARVEQRRREITTAAGRPAPRSQPLLQPVADRAPCADRRRAGDR